MQTCLEPSLKKWARNPNFWVSVTTTLPTLADGGFHYTSLMLPAWFSHGYSHWSLKGKVSQRGQEASWSRGFQNEELEVVRSGCDQILPIFPFDLIPMSFILEIRTFPYLRRDPNYLSLPIYSSYSIPKWLVYDYLHPYVEIVPTWYSFWLGERVLGELDFGHGNSLKDGLLTSWPRLYVSYFIH